VAIVNLPRSLVTLFPAPPPRRTEVRAATLQQLVDELDRQWPGMRDRLCEPGPRIRQHINVFVDGVPERELSRALSEASVVHIIPAVSGG
jgi:molybdopterin synthase sulfur carrier subunit